MWEVNYYANGRILAAVRKIQFVIFPCIAITKGNDDFKVYLAFAWGYWCLSFGLFEIKK